MFECIDCKARFEEDEIDVVETSYEAFYGVTSQFGSRTPLTLNLCPMCGSDEIEEIEEEGENEDENE